MICIMFLHEAGEILERKLKKYKNQMWLKNEGRPTSHATAERIGDTLSGADTEHSDAEEQIEIRKVKRFGIKPMFPEDAVLEMELLGHDFLCIRQLRRRIVKSMWFTAGKRAATTDPSEFE